MSNPFGNMTTQGMEETGDRLGGNFAPVPTDIYKAKINMAYALAPEAGKAGGMVLQADLEIRNEDGSLKELKEFRQTIYITKKTGENYYEKDGKKYPMPGFQTVDDICILTHPENKGLAGATFEERHVPVWDKEAKKEIPRPVQVCVTLLDKELFLAIEHRKEDATVLEGGKYVPNGQVRESNQIVKAMHVVSKQTVTEAKAGQQSTYFEEWRKRNQGKVNDQTTEASRGGKAGAPGQKPTQGSSGGTAAAAGLFNKPGA